MDINLLRYSLHRFIAFSFILFDSFVDIFQTFLFKRDHSISIRSEWIFSLVVTVSLLDKHPSRKQEEENQRDRNLKKEDRRIKVHCSFFSPLRLRSPVLQRDEKLHDYPKPLHWVDP